MARSFLTLSSLIILSYSYAQNSWMQKADTWSSCYGEVGFSIGDKGYIGTSCGSDFWEYDPSFNVWTQKADFGGSVRSYAAGFSIEDYGYIGTGRDGLGETDDFWQYDPVSNTWTEKAKFPGSKRYWAVGFSIGNKGYIGSGYSNSHYQKDFYEYDPSTNQWTQVASLTKGRKQAVGFSIGSKGYITTGLILTTGDSKEIWEYDPVADQWTEKTPCPGWARVSAAGFALNGKGYITGGFNDESGPFINLNDTWAYDPATDSWSEQDSFPGTPRYFAVGFAIGNSGYIGTGEVSYQNFLNDFWQFAPPSTCATPTGFTTTSITNSKATLNWNAVSGATKYQLRYKVIGNTTWTQVNSMATSKIIAGLNSNTAYTWQVRTVCGTNPLITSDWSGKQHFMTSLRLSLDATADGLNVYPIPFSTSAVISFSLTENSHTVIELDDLSGKKISIVLDQNLDAGDHNVELDRNQLSNGIYLLQLKTDEATRTIKILIQ